MASVQGIGGVFIDSEDAKRLAGWYEQTLGIKMESHPDGSGYYHVFQTRDPETSVMRWNPVFAIQQAKEKLPAGKRGFVVNLRVDNLDGFLEKIQSKGVYIEGKVLEWERENMPGSKMRMGIASSFTKRSF
jgi:predicted enzyme related to lactoylglutathione lyase